MTIGFDVSDLATNRADGTTRYTRELLSQFSQNSSDMDWKLFAPADFSIGKELPSNMKKFISPWPKYWTQLRLPRDLYTEKPDVLFMPIQQLPIIRPRSMATVAVIHDLAFHEFGSTTAYKDWLLLHAFTAQVARQAHHIIAISQATANDIATYYGRTKNVHVIHHGLDHTTFHEQSAEEQEASWQTLTSTYPSLRKPYILYVGQIQPRKNIVRLIEAFELLHQKNSSMQLVIAGGHGWKQQGIHKKIASSVAKDSILVTGPVPDALLPSLYVHADVFTLVSLYEGFGMPILEAMACGTPVVTSNTSCMPEVAQGAAVLVNPTNTEAIASGILEATHNRQLYREKGLSVAATYTWEKTATTILNLLKNSI